MTDKEIQKEKENIKKSLNEEINKYFNNKENYELIKKISEERSKKKQELKKFAENYLNLSYFKDKLNKEELDKYKRLGYYEVIKDCLELLQLSDKDMQFGFANVCVEKGE